MIFFNYLKRNHISKYAFHNSDDVVEARKSVEDASNIDSENDAIKKKEKESIQITYTSLYLMLFHTIVNVILNNIVYRTKRVDSSSDEKFVSLKLQSMPI